LGLVEISEGSEKLLVIEEKEIIIKISEKYLQTNQFQELDNLEQQIKEKQVALENMKDDILKIQEELQELKKEKSQLEAKVQVPPK
jgi:hypothetical protein